MHALKEKNKKDSNPWLRSPRWRMSKWINSETEPHIVWLQILRFRKINSSTNGNLVTLPNYGNHQDLIFGFQCLKFNINMNASSVQEENSEDFDPWLGKAWRRMKKWVILKKKIYIIRFQFLRFLKEILQSNGNLVNLPNYGKSSSPLLWILMSRIQQGACKFYKRRKLF